MHFLSLSNSRLIGCWSCKTVGLCGRPSSNLGHTPFRACSPTGRGSGLEIIKPNSGRPSQAPRPGRPAFVFVCRRAQCLWLYDR
jgi:hypothetical protein